MKNLTTTIISAISAFVTSLLTTLSAKTVEEVIALLKNASTELYKLKSSISDAIDEQAERFDSLIDELSLALEKKPKLEKRITGCRECEKKIKESLLPYEALLKQQNEMVENAKKLGVKMDNASIHEIEKAMAPLVAKQLKACENRGKLEDELDAVVSTLKRYTKNTTPKSVTTTIPTVKDLVEKKRENKFIPCEYMLQLRTEDRMRTDAETNKLCVGFGEVAGVRYWIDRALKECRDIRTSTNYNCVVFQVNERDAFVKKVIALNGKVIADASIATVEKKAVNQ